VRDDFVQLLETTFERDPGSVALTDEFRDYEGWDSMGHLSLVAMIDQEFDVLIAPEELENLLTVEDLYNYIQTQKQA